MCTRNLSDKPEIRRVRYYWNDNEYSKKYIIRGLYLIILDRDSLLIVPCACSCALLAIFFYNLNKINEETRNLRKSIKSMSSLSSFFQRSRILFYSRKKGKRLNTRNPNVIKIKLYNVYTRALGNSIETRSIWYRAHHSYEKRTIFPDWFIVSASLTRASLRFLFQAATRSVESIRRSQPRQNPYKVSLQRSIARCPMFLLIRLTYRCV